jgi:hypothetical protein
LSDSVFEYWLAVLFGPAAMNVSAWPVDSSLRRRFGDTGERADQAGMTGDTGHPAERLRHTRGGLLAVPEQRRDLADAGRQLARRHGHRHTGSP